MPFYQAIDGTTAAGKRTIDGCLRLREALAEAIPGKTLDTTLLMASWNIREFGGTKSGGRDLESLVYIAEILSRFDLIAVQEVRSDLDSLDQLMRILGGWWKYLVSDVTIGRSGNDERTAFLYDSRKLAFGGLAGELVPEAKKVDGLLTSPDAFSRSPFLGGFRAGWFKFTICSMHMYYGDDSADVPQRHRDAELAAMLLKKRMKQKDRWANNAILLGDFNVFHLDDNTFNALTREDFHIPAGLRGQYTNANQDKPFDQMAFIAPDLKHQLDVAKAGVFPFFEHVYRMEDHAAYLPEETDRKFKTWRTYKMSDHLPIWCELQIDFANEYLQSKRNLSSETERNS
jgi:endonuclease/exonuclease/phosphatase family metal-dependent hydrolase